MTRPEYFPSNGGKETGYERDAADASKEADLNQRN